MCSPEEHVGSFNGTMSHAGFPLAHLTGYWHPSCLAVSTQVPTLPSQSGPAPPMALLVVCVLRSHVFSLLSFTDKHNSYCMTSNT